ncbi:Fumarylacetoacetate hydrolase domain-containing protein 2 [Mycena kentingensis (nom. inval.)]|nr:Fumarylacetoacetate hydrolase domain-containing protein 2 [Mycena kentingensis (nom. inval.)]
MLFTRTLVPLLALAFTTHAQRFVRFEATDGKEYYGDAILPSGSLDAATSKAAYVIHGDILGHYKVTKEVKKIKKLLAPLPAERVHTVRAVGFNFGTHIKDAFPPCEALLLTYRCSETNTTVPEWPVLAHPTLKPETELVIVIKKRVYNISEEDALDAVLGYSVGNDVSHRGWQVDRAGFPPQFSRGKDADMFAPWGPAIVSTNIIKDPQTLNLWTKVNGVTMQNDTTANMIFNVRRLVSFLSMGTTLEKGDLIFSGTPSGVNFGKPNPVWLTDGDVVEVGLENVGICTNKIRHLRQTTIQRLTAVFALLASPLATFVAAIDHVYISYPDINFAFLLPGASLPVMSPSDVLAALDRAGASFKSTTIPGSSFPLIRLLPGWLPRHLIIGAALRANAPDVCAALARLACSPALDFLEEITIRVSVFVSPGRADYVPAPWSALDSKLAKKSLLPRLHTVNIIPAELQGRRG